MTTSDASADLRVDGLDLSTVRLERPGYVGVVLLECRPVVERVPRWQGWLTGLVAVGALVVLANVYVGLVGLSALV
jgi:hypothetical protein